MKERPILFSDEMVRAILEGRKTQTRRVLRLQPHDILPIMVPNLWWVLLKTNDPHGRLAKCRFGISGDRLWVRETWAELCRVADPYCECEETDKARFHYYEYKADSGDRFPGGWDDAEKDEQGEDYVPRWKPSIFMPRVASRITLEIVGIRVERIQDISEADAEAEGIHLSSLPQAERHNHPRKHIVAYREIWDLLNAKKGFGWETNPWVWVIEFKRIVSNAEDSI